MSARERGYEDHFDFDTLFYDVFAAADGNEILAICPPLLNCEAAIRSATYRRASDGQPLRHQFSAILSGALVRIERGSGELPTSIVMQVGGHAIEITVQPTGCSMFSGRRVVYTLSKNNPLHWITDWAHYNVQVHGADAVILYDNGSTAYSVRDVDRALGDVAGLKRWLVVDWSFPYGPGHGPNGEWDSNYCQNRAFAHVRLRHSQETAGVLNSDIDELVISRTGQSVFEALEQSGLPCLTFAGRWVTAIRPRHRRWASLHQGRSGESLLHTDCLYLTDEAPYPNKWIVVPSRCPSDAVWGTHAVEGLEGSAAAARDASAPTTQAFEFRHCRQISDNWKYRRAHIARYSRATQYDNELAAALSKAFPERRVFRNHGGPMRRLLDRLRQY